MHCTSPLGENDKILITCYVRPMHLPCSFFTNKFLAPLPGTCVTTQGDFSIIVVYFFFLCFLLCSLFVDIYAFH